MRGKGQREGDREDRSRKWEETRGPEGRAVGGVHRIAGNISP